MPAVDVRQLIRAEAREIERRAYRLKREFDSAAGFWGWMHHLVGSVAVVLAALAGVSVLAEWLSTTLQGLLAILAAGLTALTTFMAAEASQGSRRRTAARYGLIRDQARLLRRIDVEADGDDSSASNVELRERLEKLFNDLATLHAESPQILGPIRWIAGRKVQRDSAPWSGDSFMDRGV
jgi:hypothetical protein